MPSDNSVLVSLKELRRIESRRVDLEQEDRLRLEMERRRRLEEEQRVAELEDVRCRREIEEQERRERQRCERDAREERLRLAEAERRARVEAELTLERERIAMHMKHSQRRAGNVTRRVVFVAVVLVFGVVVAYLGVALRGAASRNRVLVAKLDVLAERSEATEIEARKQIDLLGRQVGQLRARLHEAQVSRVASRPTHQPRHRPRPQTKTPPDPPKIGEECRDSTDPICGLTGKQRR